MDLLKTIKGVNYFEVGSEFDYLKATQDYLGLRLFPLLKTENIKIAMQNLVEGGELPVIALVHALDTESRKGDRPELEEFKYDIFLVKQSLNQGEELKKKLKDAGLNLTERTLMEAIYNDARNLINAVVSRMEVMACELLATGKITIKENEIDRTVDYNIPDANKIVLREWATVSHDIIGDLVAIKNKNQSIVRGYTSTKMMSYMISNTAIKALATDMKTYPTVDFVKNYLGSLLGIEFVTYDKEYKKSHLSTEKFRFFPQDTISFVTTKGELGKTYCTTTPHEDYGLIEYSANAMVTIITEETKDPAGIKTLAEGYGVPVLRDKNNIVIAKLV